MAQPDHAVTAPPEKRRAELSGKEQNRESIETGNLSADSQQWADQFERAESEEARKYRQASSGS